MIRIPLIWPQHLFLVHLWSVSTLPGTTFLLMALLSQRPLLHPWNSCLLMLWPLLLCLSQVMICLLLVVLLRFLQMFIDCQLILWLLERRTTLGSQTQNMWCSFQQRFMSLWVRPRPCLIRIGSWLWHLNMRHWWQIKLGSWFVVFRSRMCSTTSGSSRIKWILMIPSLAAKPLGCEWSSLVQGVGLRSDLCTSHQASYILSGIVSCN